MSSDGICVIEKCFIPSRIDFLNIIIAKSTCEWISVIKNGTMSASNPEVVVDHVSDLSSAKEPVFFLSLLFLQTDLSLEVGILDGLCSEQTQSSHPASQNSGK